MIITKVRIQEDHPMQAISGGQTYPLPIVDFNLNSTAGENGYLTKDIVGLGPTKQKAVVEGSDTTGVPILGNQAEKRQIAVRTGLQPILGKSFSHLRDDLYKYMSRSVLVSLMDGSMIKAQARGYISAMDPVHFTTQPEIQFFVDCNDGELTAPKKTDIPLSTLNTLNPLISYEDGTAPTGLTMQFTVTANHSNFSFTNHSRLWYVGDVAVTNALTVTLAFLTGDIVKISTHPNNRRISVTRAGVEYDLGGYVNAGAIWPKLYAGVNTLSWTMASSWMTWNSASYIPRFWGV